MPGETANDLESPGTSGSLPTRERRVQKKDAKLSKFEALRQARESGKKVKYQVEEVRPVYDYVDEDEYSKIVSDRQMQQFVDVVEGASEDYYDDGREIFDDDYDDASLEKMKKGQQKGPRSVKPHGNKSEKTEPNEKPAVRSGDIRNMFAAAHARPKKEVEPTAIVREALFEDILEQLNGDVSLPKPPSRSAILFGSTGQSVEDILAASEHEDIFKKSILRKKMKVPPTEVQAEPSPASGSELSCSSPNLRKRVFQASPVKKEPLEETKPKIDEKNLTNFGFLRNFSAAASPKRHKVAPPTTKPTPQIAWEEDSYDMSNASYEVDSMLQETSTELDDGWIPDFEDDVKPFVQPFVQPISIKPVPRTLPKFEKKWGEEDQARPQPLHPAAEMEVRFSGMQVASQAGLRIYWLDACEDLATKGCINLFGKVCRPNGPVSVCVKVKNIERRLFFLLRKKKFEVENKEEREDIVGYEDVEDEFKDRIMRKYGINSKYRSLRTTKQYAFDYADVPDSAQYLEIRYPFSEPMLPENLSGESFSHVFGRNTSALEIFLLDRKVKGPCWMDIEGAVVAPTPSTWCKEEYIIDGAKNVTVTSDQQNPPKVTVMAIQLKIVVDPRTKQNEIAAAALLIHTNFPLNTAAPSPVWEDHRIILSESSDRRFPMKFAADIMKQTKYKVMPVNGEKSLLDALLTNIKDFDPDVLVFHDGIGYQLDILLHRLSILSKGSNWSRLGRLQRREMPKGRHAGTLAATGRLICDVKHSAEELIHSKSYDLTELVRVVLNDQHGGPRQEIESDMVADMYQTRERMEIFIDNTLLDACFTLRIMAELNAIPLALQITNIAGNVMSRTLLGGRSERNEFLLLHAFTGRNYICPDKQFREFHKKDAKAPLKNPKKVKDESQETGEDQKEELTMALADEEKENPPDQMTVEAETTHATTGKRKPAYAGGLVLEPKKGLYDTYVLLMDFNSLYPSIIQEYNICFTTVDRQAMARASANQQDDFLPDIIGGSESNKPGVLPTEIKILVDRRQEVKKLLKEAEEKAKNKNLKETEALSIQAKIVELNIRQKALKLTANSMYGCLGFTMSRFFARPLAALITSKGREILMSTKELIEKQNLDVIYGDTDSVMINTHSLDWDAVMKIGSDVKSRVDKMYKCLKLDVDGVFRSLLLLQKKKYAALVASKKEGKVQYKRELKGLDIVRRDWSLLAADSGRYVIDQILSDQQRDIVQGNILAGLKNIGEFMKGDSEGKKSLFEVFEKRGYFACRDELDLFAITKQLTKDPSLYSDAKSLPHVQVAQRWNQSTTTTKKFKAGDTVAYIICNEVPAGVAVIGSKKVPHTQRGYHIEEVRGNVSALSIDKQYYLAEQVYKVVNRLCDPIEGVDSAAIADCLGIDKSLFPNYYVDRSAVEEEKTQGFVTDTELYRDCLPLLVVCPGCRNNWKFDEPIWQEDDKQWLSLKKCSDPFCDEEPGQYLDKILNCLRIQMGFAIQKYYKPTFVCQDAGCHYQCSFVPPKFHVGQPVCPACEKAVLKPEYSDRDLYLQLCYWKNAFDPQRALEKVKSKSWHAPLVAALARDVEVKDKYAILAAFVQSFLDRSSYGRVNFSDFFPMPSIVMGSRVELRKMF